MHAIFRVPLPSLHKRRCERRISPCPRSFRNFNAFFVFRNFLLRLSSTISILGVPLPSPRERCCEHQISPCFRSFRNFNGFKNICNCVLLRLPSTISIFWSQKGGFDTDTLDYFEQCMLFLVNFLVPEKEGSVQILSTNLANARYF